MALRIDPDHRRFRDIVRGKIKQNLRKYISQGELIGRKGKDLVSIPLPQIDIPRFRFGDKQQGGVGQGEGEVGDALGQGRPDADGQGKAGDQAGRARCSRSTSRSRSWPQILGEELRAAATSSPRARSSIVSAQGPLHRHPPRRARVAAPLQAHLPRRRCGAQIAIGHLRPEEPGHRPDPRGQALPLVEDRCRCRSRNAVIIYMMDVSGSMGDEQKEIVRIETFWIDTWLRSQYKGLESRYIIHDAVAQEVDRDTFFHTRESGGTMISSAYKLCAKMIDDDYPPERVEHLPVPLLRRRQLVGRRHASRASSS